MSTATPTTVSERVAGLDWSVLRAELDEHGRAPVPPLLTAAECAEIAAWYDQPTRFRARVDMARHRFGDGEYQYFADPLPAVVAGLRTAFYPQLATVADDWQQRLGRPDRFPADLDTFLDRCHAAGQTKPTPLLLRYGPGGHNALHQDLYGELVFPLQVVIGLDRPGEDYAGGEFLLVQQRPRAQSVGEAITLPHGGGLIFPTRERPVRGARGDYRVALRHGVSRLRAGRRHTLGLVFHDAA